MSLTMDDLCASLSSSAHIGQEALDLAALQLQLAETLFRQAIPSQRTPDDYAQPCNTPTARTPSASFSWSPMVDMSREPVTPRRDSEIEMDEDERMVEDILMPSSPVQPQSPSTPVHTQPFPSSTQADASPSLFAATDPFYLAQVQATQSYSVPHIRTSSVFAQAAFPTTQSPFFMQHSVQNHPQPALTMDHSLPLIAPVSTFDR
ncbi:hypothetical protein MKEN_00051900 [Mycena kentingensis (nom. inval.)]|nr:hypothetical protein MKEN_00051900 [Mycena kentingensis (nom. inval.)]